MKSNGPHKGNWALSLPSLFSSPLLCSTSSSASVNTHSETFSTSLSFSLFLSPTKWHSRWASTPANCLYIQGPQRFFAFYLLRLVTLSSVSSLSPSLLLNLTPLTFHTLQSLFIGQLSLLHTNSTSFSLSNTKFGSSFRASESINHWMPCLYTPAFPTLAQPFRRLVSKLASLRFLFYFTLFSSPLFSSYSFFHSKIPQTLGLFFISFFFFFK